LNSGIFRAGFLMVAANKNNRKTPVWPIKPDHALLALVAVFS